MEGNRSDFSKRFGFVPDSFNLQIDSMNQMLRKGLWLIYLNCILLPLKPKHIFAGVVDHSEMEDYLRNFYRKFADDYPEVIEPDIDYYIEDVKDAFFRSEWYIPYEIIEDALTLPYFDNKVVEKLINKILNDEQSAYRLIEGVFCPVSSDLEIQSIQNAVESITQYSVLAGANVHLKAALKHLSSKENPDYRNSMKESISAIEVVCRLATGESTLGNALKKIEHKSIKVNKQLVESFNKLYDYTNDKQTGIRHAIVDAHEPPDKNTAQFFLVSCSAFINYFIPLASEAGRLSK